jgi:alcohol dehydrogenase
MPDLKGRAAAALKEFKGEAYAFGGGVLDAAPGKFAAELGIELIVAGLVTAKKDASSREARTLLGLGTDLGGYAIMIGGTSGAHLTSFSLVDVLSHGRAAR